MATGTNIGVIGQGTPTVVTPSVEVLGAAQSGTVGALHVLTHPTSSSFPPLTYDLNPTYVVNMDNKVLRPASSGLVQTFDSSAVVRFDFNVIDVPITEVWEGNRSNASMRGSFFRLLYEYYINTPTFDALSPEYITWQPRQFNAKTYNIEILDLTVGGRGADAFRMRQLRLPASTGAAAHGLEAQGQLDAWLQEEVRLRFRVVSEV